MTGVIARQHADQAAQQHADQAARQPADPAARQTDDPAARQPADPAARQHAYQAARKPADPAARQTDDLAARQLDSPTYQFISYCPHNKGRNWTSDSYQDSYRVILRTFQIATSIVWQKKDRNGKKHYYKQILKLR